MLTTHELRVLYLLRKYGRPAKLMELSHGMARFSAEQRKQALANCEDLELISSAKTPAPKGPGGSGGMVYWLTKEGKKYVHFMIDSGGMADPAKEPRAGKKRRSR